MRKEKGLTQEQLAEKLGKSRLMIAYVETAREKPNLKMLQKIAKALGRKVNKLVAARGN